MRWWVTDYDFGGTDTVLVTVTNGTDVIQFMADVEFDRRKAVSRGVHVQGGGRNTLGPAALRRLIRWVKDQLDVDELRIEGAARTSGAAPGRVPPALVF
jgi:hypothetical protein